MKTTMNMKYAALAIVLGLSGSVLAQSLTQVPAPTMFISAANPQVIMNGMSKVHLPVTVTMNENEATYILQVTHNVRDTRANLAANCAGSFQGGGQLIVQTGFKTVHSADCAAAQSETGVQLLDGKTHAVLLQYTVANQNDKAIGTDAAKHLSLYFRTR